MWWTSPPDQQSQEEIYKLDKLSRDSAIFGIGVSVLIGLRFVSMYYLGVATIAGSLTIFYMLERQVSFVIRDIIMTGSYSNAKPEFLIAMSLGGFFITAMVMHWEGSYEAIQFIDVLLCAVLRSIAIFSGSLGIQALLIGSKLIKPPLVRRGFFGVYSRIIVLIRSFSMAAKWGIWLSRREKLPRFSLTLYGIAKLCLFLSLSVDLGRSFLDFKKNGELAFQDAEKSQGNQTCMICLTDSPIEPKALRCGHVFCYSCLNSWVVMKAKSFCPSCRAELTPPIHIDLSDGSISVSLFVCVV
jgi:hypothetical protein